MQISDMKKLCDILECITGTDTAWVIDGAAHDVIFLALMIPENDHETIKALSDIGVTWSDEYDSWVLYV